MGTEVGKSNDKYEWQAWPADSLEGMPPKRRRLVVWGLWLFMLLSIVLSSVLEAADVPEPGRSLVVLVGVAAFFGPLLRGAIMETRQLRTEGIILPAISVTRKVLVSAAVMTTVLWIFFVILGAIGRPMNPVVPLVGTLWLAFQLLQRRSA
ncbi:hypothetical protein GCM10010523_10590 [Paenarthrobacter ilicis]|uniref:Integral membrane protein n=2 Tax=Paenarthrobacter ilicis TaxID=43665 RepID=A0ABX0TMR3_9MICC|nr:hypothetical protein [Paenarthrobacter ilicis]NIJ02406.1 hypothetical protein [Paenarthrobacter ilicis]